MKDSIGGRVAARQNVCLQGKIGYDAHIHDLLKGFKGYFEAVTSVEWKTWIMKLKMRI